MNETFICRCFETAVLKNMIWDSCKTGRLYGYWSNWSYNSPKTFSV